jgi:predicted double-glycine peptidase
MKKRARPRRYKPITKGAIKIPLPDVTQVTGYSCGASSLEAICKYFGAGPDNEWDFTDAIHYDHRIGAGPEQIMAAARDFGLKCKPFPNMSNEELMRQIDKKRPVMIMIQAWGEEKVDGKSRWIRDYRHVWQKGHRAVYRNGRMIKAALKGRYIVDWHDGHWVVAIGYNKLGFFFEDPSLHAIRGFMSYDELDARWRDTGKAGKHIPRFGVAIWKHGARRSMYETRAQYIE